MNLLNVEDLKFLLMLNLMESFHAFGFVNTYWISSVWNTTAASFFKVLTTYRWISSWIFVSFNMQPHYICLLTRHQTYWETRHCGYLLYDFPKQIWGSRMSNVPYCNPQTGVNEQKNTECRGMCIYIVLWGRTVVTTVEHFIRWQW